MIPINLSPFFVKIGSTLAEEFLDVPEYGNKKVNEHTFFVNPVSALEVKNVLIGCKSKKLLGRDGVNMYTLKLAAVVLCQPLSLFFTNCIKLGNFSAALKLARVRLLVKSTKTNDANDYRPISLLPAISKLFEKLFQSRLMKFIKKHRLLNPCQYGFRANNPCCSHALIVLTEFMSDTYDTKIDVSLI